MDEPRALGAVEAPALPKTLSDEALARAIADGRSELFDELHRRLAPRLHGFARRRGASPQDAEEIAQDVFLQIFLCIDRFEGRSSFLTWVFGIAQRRLCRHQRRKGPAALSLEGVAETAIEAPRFAMERHLDARRALARCERVVRLELSRSHREIFQLRYGRGVSTRSIARDTGRSSEAVKMRAWRARRAVIERAPELLGLLES